MAMVQLDSTITEIEGKQGGVIFRKDVCGQHIQAFPRETKHETPAQRKQRRAFRGALTYCSKDPDFLLNIDKWWIWSYNHPLINKKGEEKFNTPWLACIRINTIRLRNDLEPTPIPPE